MKQSAVNKSNQAIYADEICINATEGYRTGETGIYETFTDNAGELFKSCQKDYGRCIGKVYIDRDGKELHIGWIFQKRAKYTDAGGAYLQETWITLHTGPEERTVKYNYLVM